MKQSENLCMMCLKTIKKQTYKINILFTTISFVYDIGNESYMNCGNEMK